MIGFPISLVRTAVGSVSIVEGTAVSYVLLVLGEQKMCDVCREAYLAGHITKSEIWRCVYYLDFTRRVRDELRRIPKREPDDPLYVLSRGEGLLPWMFTQEEEDFYFDEIWKWTRRRRLNRLKASGKGAERSRRESVRGVEDETNGRLKLYDY